LVGRLAPLVDDSCQHEDEKCHKKSAKQKGQQQAAAAVATSKTTVELD